MLFRLTTNRFVLIGHISILYILIGAPFRKQKSIVRNWWRLRLVKLKNSYTSIPSGQANNPALAKSQLEKGIFYVKQWEFEKAASAFLNAIESAPSSADGHNFLSAVYIKQGLYEKAEEHAAKANELNPDISGVNWMVAMEGNRLTRKIKNNPTPALYNKRGLLSFYQNAFEAAKKDLEMAISLYPDYISAYGHLGNICMKMGLFDEAEKAFDGGADRALEEFDNQQLLLMKQWRLLICKIALKPSARLCTEVGEMYLEQNTLPTLKIAQKYFTQALELDSTHAVAQNKLNLVHEKLRHGV